MKRLFLATAIACLFPGLAHAQGGGVFKPEDAARTPLQREDIRIQGHDGRAHVFHVELALGPEDQEYGLMFRRHLAPDAGMLFVFPLEAEQGFWMKNTLIPLDMLFIGKDGVIRHIHENARPNDLTQVPSQGPALAVLELNGGAAAKFGVHEGDIVRDKTYFKNAP